MPVVSNTSPLMNLAVIGRLELIKEQFGRVWMPEAVLEELRTEDNLPGSQLIREAVQSGWLAASEVQDKTLVRTLRQDLDRGEAEAIALALQMSAGYLLIDEREGRRIAKSLGLQVTGVLGILLKAWTNRKIPSLKDAIEDLRNKAGFRIKPALVSEILSASDEKADE